MYESNSFCCFTEIPAYLRSLEFWKAQRNSEPQILWHFVEEMLSHRPQRETGETDSYIDPWFLSESHCRLWKVLLPEQTETVELVHKQFTCLYAVHITPGNWHCFITSNISCFQTFHNVLDFEPIKNLEILTYRDRVFATTCVCFQLIKVIPAGRKQAETTCLCYCL